MTHLAIVTGGNRGLGFATSKKLAQRGVGVILTSRDAQRGAEAVAAIRAEVPGADVRTLSLDLASLASVRRFADEFHALGLPLHILLNSGGGMMVGDKARFTKDGFELTFGTNHLGHFLLTNLLLDDLKQSAPARVITVSSQTHIPGVDRGPQDKQVNFDWDNLFAEKGYDEEVFYKNSKLANMWFTYELQRWLEGTGVTSNAVCPGYVPATLADYQPTRRGRFMFRYVLPLLPWARSVKQATDNYIYAALDPTLEGVGGKFIVDCRFKRSSDQSYNEEDARRLWEMSEKWVGLTGEANSLSGIGRQA